MDPFSVDASPTVTIDQLKTIINEKIKAVSPAHAFKLVLGKPKEAILVKPSNTLAQCLDGLWLDFLQMVDELDPVDTAAAIFQPLMPTSPHLSILVKLPPPTLLEEPPHKRRHLDHDSNLGVESHEILQEFWENLWQSHKKPFGKMDVVRDPNPVQSIDVPATIKVLSLPEVLSPISTVMVRDEYDEAMKYIENRRADEGGQQMRGIIIAGHPGIGKTTLLCCILAQRLFEKKPTVFQNRSDYVYIFDKNGYRRHRASITVNFRGVAHQDTWALVDMSPRVETLSDFIQDSPFFTVIASSPRPSRWYQIMRYRGLLARWFMKPFSLAELIQARQLQLFRHKEADIENFFEMYGPSARDCYTFCHDKFLPGYNTLIREEIDEMGLGWNSLTDILTWQMLGMDMDKGSHMVVLFGPQPDDRTAPMTGIVTDTVSQLLWEQDSKEQWRNYHQLFRTLLREPSAVGFCGRGLLEPAFHELCVGGGTFTIYQITAKCQEVNYKFTANNLNDCDSETLTLSSQTRKFFNRKSRIDSLLPNYYYQPTASNQSSYDSFIYDPNSHQISAFQVTVGKNHSLASKGDFELRKLGQRLEVGDLKIRIIVVVFENAQITFTIDKDLFDGEGLKVYILQVTEDQLYPTLNSS